MHLLFYAYDDCDGASDFMYAFVTIGESDLAKLEGRCLLAKGVQGVDSSLYALEFWSMAADWYAGEAFDLGESDEDVLSDHGYMVWEGPDPKADPLRTDCDVVACQPDGDVCWNATGKHSDVRLNTMTINVKDLRELLAQASPTA